eukprot:8329744-Ditylum_brightwellii.AAC.1
MCMQFHLQGASEKVPTMYIGDKVRSLIVKLHEAHAKYFIIFTEDDKLIQLKTFPEKGTGDQEVPQLCGVQQI